MAAAAADTKEEKREPSRLDALMEKDIQVVGAEIPAGSYGATLISFSEPWDMDATSSKFYKEGDPKMKTVFEAEWAVYDKQGVPALLNHLLPFPEDGLANRRSNVYKVLKALATGSKLLDEKTGAFAKGTKLSSFIGKTAILAVKLNAKEFPNVETVSPAMDGVKYPTLKEGQAIPKVERSQDLPF